MTEFKEKRSERRSFYCPNKLWAEMLEECKDCISVSDFIKQAIKEKLEKKSFNEFRN